jgi:hypothetical protein
MKGIPNVMQYFFAVSYFFVSILTSFHMMFLVWLYLLVPCSTITDYNNLQWPVTFFKLDATEDQIHPCFDCMKMSLVGIIEI